MTGPSASEKSFHQRIVFIEGEEASADREVYEKLYPPGVHHVSFVPAGNSAAVRKTAEQVNHLLSAAVEFQHYFSVVDADIERAVAAPVRGGRLFQLSVYHVENFLLDAELIFLVTKAMLGPKCPYETGADVEAALKRLAVEPRHLKPYARTLHDARVARVAKEAWDSVYRKQSFSPSLPAFEQTERDSEELIKSAVADGSWRAKCKGRDLLKAYAAQHGLNYEHFRNCIIERMTEPPEALAAIMTRILSR